METIHIYHTNDLHSHFENWPKITRFLRKQKSLHENAEDEVLIFDTGDHVDRFHPLSDGTKGKGNIELLNKANYSAVTIGNNEGITFPHEDLDQMYQDASYPVLVANLYYNNGQRPNWSKPYMIHTTKKGTKIAVIGLTVFYEQLYYLLGWKLTDPFRELKRQINEVKKQADVIILLSHLGLHDDENIANEFPEIDCIFGGHTHHMLPEGKIINNTILCAAGKYGQHIGYLKLELEKQDIIKKTAQLIDTEELPTVDCEKEVIESYYLEGKQLLGEKVVHLNEDITNDPYFTSSLSRLLCEALHEWCDSDCAFINSGLLLAGLKKGIVTRFDLLEICPHPINPCIVELPGTQLKEVLLHSMKESWSELPVRGLGFRGKVMGAFTYSGISFNYGQTEIDVYIGNEKLLPLKKYKLAIPDMFTFGRYFPEIYHAKYKEYFLPEFMRDILEWKLKSIHA